MANIKKTTERCLSVIFVSRNRLRERFGDLRRWCQLYSVTLVDTVGKSTSLKCRNDLRVNWKQEMSSEFAFSNCSLQNCFHSFLMCKVGMVIFEHWMVSPLTEFSTKCFVVMRIFIDTGFLNFVIKWKTIFDKNFDWRYLN